MRSAPALERMGSGADAASAAQAAAAQNMEIERLCQTLGSIVSQINTLYERTLADHKEGIAGLAVEIARMVLAQKVQDGDYRIETIIKEALDKAPPHPEITVHLHPEDFVRCQKLQDQDPDGPLWGVTLVSDSGLGRAECVVATPKGSVRAVIERQLERIREALGKVR